MDSRGVHKVFNLPYCLVSSRFHVAALSIAIVAFSFFVFDLNNVIISNNNNNGIAYAHIFNDTENAVTKNVDGGKYQVSFLPYPAGLIVNDTSTKLNFSVMKNSTDVPFLFTSLLIMDRNTGERIERTPYKFHEFGDVTYPYIFQKEGNYKVAIQAKINGDPKYEASPLTTSFDVAVRDMEKMTNSFQQIMLFYVTPALAAIVGSIIYIQRKKERKRINK